MPCKLFVLWSALAESSYCRFASTPFHRIAMAVFHLRREVFTHGILSSDLLHLTDANLLHLAQQLSLTLLAHTSGSTAALKYTTWLSAAVELLRCSEHTAKIYFESFLGVHNKNVHKHGGPKLLLSADVGEFMLFLFIQRYRAAAAQQSTMAFVQQNLHVLLMLVRDPHKHVHDFSLPLSPHSAHSPRTPSSPSSSSSSSASAGHPLNHALDAHEFNRLGFLFFAHNKQKETEEQLERIKENQETIEPPTERREVLNLASLTPFYSGQSSASAASPTASGASVPLSVVEEWLLAHLAHADTVAPVGRPIVHHGHLLYPPVVSVCEVSNWDGKTAVYGAREAQGGDLLVKQCNNSALSVYTHSRYATIEDCSHSSVNAGVASGLVIVRKLRPSDVDSGVSQHSYRRFASTARSSSSLPLVLSSLAPTLSRSSLHRTTRTTRRCRQTCLSLVYLPLSTAGRPHC